MWLKHRRETIWVDEWRDRDVSRGRKATNLSSSHSVLKVGAEPSVDNMI